MELKKLNCPGCGANVIPQDSDYLFCAHCKGYSYLDRGDLQWKVNKSLSITPQYLDNGLIKIIVNSKVDSIIEIIKTMNEINLPVLKVSALVANDNNISNLHGLYNFISLGSLEIKNNKIRVIDAETIKYFKQRIFLSSVFYLDLTGNAYLEPSFLSQLNFNDNVTSLEWQYITIPEIENDVKKIIEEIKDAERRWERTETISRIPRSFGNFQNYIIRNPGNIYFRSETS